LPQNSVRKQNLKKAVLAKKSLLGTSFFESMPGKKMVRNKAPMPPKGAVTPQADKQKKKKKKKEIRHFLEKVSVTAFEMLHCCSFLH
jgi:hypothetical protein